MGDARPSRFAAVPVPSSPAQRPLVRLGYRNVGAGPWRPRFQHAADAEAFGEAQKLPPTNRGSKPVTMAQRVDSLTPAGLTTLAATLGAKILLDATETSDGSLTWGRGYDRARRPIADAGLFNGRIGEALLFAALARATGDARFAAAAERVVLPLRRRLRAPNGPNATARETGLGLMGLGSMLYGLVRIGQYLGEPSIIADTRLAAAGLASATIHSDHRCEIGWGTSGLILGLLAVHETGDGVALDQATRCGAHLLERRVADPVTGLRAWPTHGGMPSAGFAHGSSGIAHALLELYRRVPDSLYPDAAIEAFAYERALYCKETGDWPDVRGQTTAVFCSWCHGAPGVGFSRLAALRNLTDRDQHGLLADLRVTLRRTVSYQATGEPDNLCCGNLGRADFLLEAGIRLGNPSLVDAANMILGKCVRAATPEGYFMLPVYTEAHTQPGLWQGLTGIAYTLLRFGAPQAHRCLLLLS